VRIAVTGSTGLIGTALVAALRDGGHRVIRLVRQTPASEDEIAWDPLAPTGGLAPGALDGLDAAIHLALDRRLQRGDPGEPGPGHPGTGRCAGRGERAALRSAVRLGHRLVRGHRRAGGR
jgi:NAD dependent epimerase/dehydratase family